MGPDDFDADGFVRADVVDGWLAEARDAYLERCVGVRELRDRPGLEFRFRTCAGAGARAVGPADRRVVTARAPPSSIPTSFTLAFRLRPTDGDGDGAINVRSVLTLEIRRPAPQPSSATTCATS